ncbi:MarR family winged helix-turn-helix transcriptional regulator [Phenylobacterium sp.]|uniref:MarR family winged helix-turn-helix transcriptional regulator n=1 Tax=Phenylobacterium sp. TaxID=1871053 RepID=UPI0025FE2C22|nr:MarR family transcriptional regulator [Phenylobacterium sp.]
MRRALPQDYSVDSTGEFPLSPPEYLFYLIFQTSRQRDLSFDRAGGRGTLSLTQLRTLAVIRRIENCSMKDLALFSGVDRTTLTRAVDQLVRGGLVERWSPAGDRRRVIVSLSAEGEALHSRAVEGAVSRHARFTAGLDETEIRAAARVLQRVLRNLMDDPLEAETLLDYGRPLGGRRAAVNRSAP